MLCLKGIWKMSKPLEQHMDLFYKDMVTFCHSVHTTFVLLLPLLDGLISENCIFKIHDGRNKIRMITVSKVFLLHITWSIFITNNRKIIQVHFTLQENSCQFKMDIDVYWNYKNPCEHLNFFVTEPWNRKHGLFMCNNTRWQEVEHNRWTVSDKSLEGNYQNQLLLRIIPTDLRHTYYL